MPSLGFPNLPQCTCQFGMHAVFFIPYVEPQCRSECWVDVNHDSDLIWIPPGLFSLSQKNLLARSQSFPSLGLCCLAYRLPSPCTVMAGAIQPACSMPEEFLKRTVGS